MTILLWKTSGNWQILQVAISAHLHAALKNMQKEILALGINTVDSFDIHTGIVDLRRELSALCQKQAMPFLSFRQAGIRVIW